MSTPSATFAVWVSAWLNGSAAADDVLDALSHWSQAHDVVAVDESTADTLDVPPRGRAGGQVAALLATVRRVGATGGRMVLPVPGDVRGLGGRSEFAGVALHAGEALVLHGAPYGLVPEPIADGVLRWTAFDIGAAPAAEHLPLGEAEHELTGAMRVAAGVLTELGVAKHRAGVREEITARIAHRSAAPWPEGTPPRALRVLQRSNEVSAILELASEDAPGNALSSSSARRRAEALRPLFDAVRMARLAAVDEAVRVFSDHAEQL
ncbi:hypothetical protein V5P93_004898 [Actinokineospora auranticolor]|uniref:Uncharacterized protein n=1 Tax=Actinokineospora auranticolor TaxID=155976 RepID=A0A2S6GNV2_9PSEU|nr:hypothetical protein [Actinokineospora auranticolor]PPK66860.1 hypothetical protein CLV40_109245 [Actinokineospora auranticolor]